MEGNVDYITLDGESLTPEDLFTLTTGKTKIRVSRLS